MSSKLSSKKRVPAPRPSEKAEAEQFHPDQKICEIIPTTKKDASYQSRPPGTVEEPPPPVPVKRKVKPPKDHHHGPVWVFEDEIRAAKCEIEQKIALKEMKARIRKKTKHEDDLRIYRHKDVLKRRGPEWFHELSPSQLKAADELRNCIQLDLLKRTIAHTQETIGRLGLVLRPNPKHLGIALAYSCGNPVEFLLIFYQISNPKRVSYSLNDKLLLSAVAHLSLRETLRELHIRIPSPPKKKKSERATKEEVKAKSPKRKMKSPYLCSFTFEPTWGKHKEEYKDNRVQHPESLYFDYVDDLRKEIAEDLPDQSEEDHQYGYGRSRRYTTSNIGCGAEERTGFYDPSLERELNDELQAAQIKYNKLTRRRRTRRLLRPSIYRPCSVCYTKNRPGFDSDSKMRAARDDEKIDVSLTVQVKITDQYDENNEHVSTKYQYQVDVEEFPIVVEEKPEGSKIVVIKEESAVGEEEEEERDLPNADSVVSGESCHCLDGSEITEESISLSSRDERVKRDLVEVEPPPPWNCTCKEIVERYVEEVVEKRKECLDVCGKKRPTLIITDTKVEDGERPVRIIGGVKAEKTCACLERFKKKMKTFEERKLRREALDALKSTKRCYVVNGVHVGIDGKPVYILSGVAEERSCPKCVAIEEFRRREEERLANMPSLPGGRQKYVISGVHQRPEGNVYVISGAVPIEECECMRLYSAFEQRHGKCMDLYNQYMHKVKTEVTEYMAEVGIEEAQKRREEEETDDEECKCVTDASLTPSDEDDEDYCNCEEEVGEGAEEEKEEEEEDTNIVITVEVGGTTGKKTSGRRRESAFEFDGTEIKRFVVLKEFPCDHGDQMKILKRSLKVLAMDGYPLAKLPHVHRMPIFKLWMDMRCGRYWTIEDKEEYLNISKFLLHHTDVCRKKTEYPKNRLTLAQSERYTWRDAKFVRAYADEINGDFYRRAKQNIINYGQEYFPTTCSYEFPTKTFRDCFFAYVPSKEEDVFVFKPWTSFDVRSLFHIRHILRGRQTC